MDLTVYVLKDQRAACVSARQERLGLGFRVNPNPSKIHYLRFTFVTKVTNSASRWNRQKPAAGFNPLYDHNHVISDWFPYKSDIAAHAREKAAQNLRLHFIRIRHCDECICRWVWSFAQLGCSRRSRNIFWNVAYTTVLKETSSLLRFHFQRRSLSCRSKLIQVARWPSGLPRMHLSHPYLINIHYITIR